MGVFETMQGFFIELRKEGIPVTTSQAYDCCQALLLLDWSEQEYFYSALYTTLIKENAYNKAFEEVFDRYFILGNQPDRERHFINNLDQQKKSPNEEEITVSDGDMSLGSSMSRGGSAQSPGGRKNPLEQNFTLANIDDIYRMENMFPLITRRLAAKMIQKRKKNDRNRIDFRRTMRHSMTTGGIPLDIFTVKKTREKAVILAICDISGSVMNFSCFALALLASMEKFFRQIKSYAFIDEIDEVSSLLTSGNPLDLRKYVLQKANVVGASGYTNYGYAFKAFYERYSGYLNHKTSVLIFGDARNNWNTDESWVLREIKSRVKKVYWFNPEAEPLWGTGDSRIYEYIKWCDNYYSCPNMLELEKAFAQL